MRVGCGSATIGIFAQQWYGHVDEVVVVDDHITGVLTEHQAGRCLDMPPSGIKMRGPQVDAGALLPGRQSRAPAGAAPTSPIRCRSSRAGTRRRARPGLRLLMVSTTGEHAAWFVLDDDLAAASSADAGGGAPRRRAHRRELRAVAVHGAVPRRRRRQPARRRHREPGAADALDQALAGQRDLRRRAGLRLARRRHHGDGRRAAHARQQLRHGADAGDRRADRVQHAARRLSRRSAATWSMCSRSSRRWRAAPGRTTVRRWRAVAAHGRGQSLAAWASRRCSAEQHDRPTHRARRRPLALPARPDRHRRRRARRRGRGRRRARARVAALRDGARRAGGRAAAAAPAASPRPTARCAARSRAACGRPARRSAPASSRRWPRSPARWRRS